MNAPLLPPVPALAQPAGPGHRFQFAGPASVKIVITQAGRTTTQVWTGADDFVFEVRGARPPLFRTAGPLSLTWAIRLPAGGTDDGPHSETASYQSPLTFAIEVREGEMTERWSGWSRCWGTATSSASSPGRWRATGRTPTGTTSSRKASSAPGGRSPGR